MKRLISIIMVMLTLCLLAGCGAEAQPPELITFPGVSWNVTPEEFLETMKMTEDDWTLEAEMPDKVVYKAENIKVFGDKGTVYFDFRCFNTEGYYGFYAAYVIYPESVDLNAVKARMVAEYGPYTVHRAAGEALCYWEGTDTMEKYLPKLGLNPREGGPLPASRLYWCSDVPSLPLPYPFLMYNLSDSNMVSFNGNVTQMLQWIEFGIPPVTTAGE